MKTTAVAKTTTAVAATAAAQTVAAAQRNLIVKASTSQRNANKWKETSDRLKQWHQIRI